MLKIMALSEDIFFNYKINQVKVLFPSSYEEGNIYKNTLIDMSEIIVKCPACVKEGKKSTCEYNYDRNCSHSGTHEEKSFYDEDGHHHLHYIENGTTWMKCSNKHEFALLISSLSCSSKNAKVDCKRKREVVIKEL